MIRLSLVIPTYNRAAPLLAALESVVRQDLPLQEWECVVVNNNSPDDTEARFGAFAAAHPGVTLRMVREESPGVSYARNRGACGGARGDRGLHRRRRAGERRLPEGLCRLFSTRIPRPSWPVGASSPSIPGTSGVDVEVGRDADRQSDGFRRRGASLSRGTGSGRRQHGVPAGGAGGIRRFRSLARPGERRVRSAARENDFFERLRRRRDDLVRSRCGDVAYHPPRRSSRRSTSGG